MGAALTPLWLNFKERPKWGGAVVRAALYTNHEPRLLLLTHRAGLDFSLSSYLVRSVLRTRLCTDAYCTVCHEARWGDHASLSQLLRGWVNGVACLGK